ncbi:GNAT family N-acetyltransferase [Endozoicomonas numazuensis]|uniref:Acetyltransferase n=1 Tax=Endozoicomonas numazuensis TaxID=1137799 RepID=A0A081NFS8_9GAMM|nr:GNAT family protein [Endozoicomonas numazuensis]KEQ17301.1 acetyltransferase [Endozoicomonas numazuensis]
MSGIDYKDIVLRKALPDESDRLYDLVTADERWTEFNAPYFPYQTPTRDSFEQGLFQDLLEGRNKKVIEYRSQPVGTVSCYWVDENTRWLEAGIALYDSRQWGKGIGKQALVAWISHLFDTCDIARMGMTTWSGNPGMIACGESIGFKIEGRLRRVRYFKGTYYDSIKLGVLREEWQQLYDMTERR